MRNAAGRWSSPTTALDAWRNALGVTLLGCLLPGLGCFGFLASYLSERLDLLAAAIWLEVGFAVAFGLILGLIVLWQRSHGESLRELGWLRPTTVPAIAVGLLFGIAWLAFSYLGASRAMPAVDVTSLAWFRVVLAPCALLMALAEETAMRGFFMTQLERVRMPSWLQVVASAAATALYHSLPNPTLLGFLASFVLFAGLAAIYVLGRRSLTPVIAAHGVINVLGEPYLLMLFLAAPS